MYEVTLLVATLTGGLIAGLFFAFSIAVMLGLRGVDDRAFVDVMQRINRSIQNGLFGLVFVGSLLSAAAVIVLDVMDGDGLKAYAVMGAALVLMSMLITFGVNIPMNNRLDAVDPNGDVAEARRAFEGPWTTWNHVRTVVSSAGLTCLCLALQH